MDYHLLGNKTNLFELETFGLLPLCQPYNLATTGCYVCGFGALRHLIDMSD